MIQTSKGIQLGPEEENTHRGNDQQMYKKKKTNNIDGKLNNRDER